MLNSRLTLAIQLTFDEALQTKPRVKEHVISASRDARRIRYTRRADLSISMISVDQD